MMKIFGNCLVKNEADMIVETLRHAAHWCDRIFVFDNGSTDGTWEKVLELTKHEPRVVPFKSAAVPYRDSLRIDLATRALAAAPAFAAPPLRARLLQVLATIAHV